MKIFTSHEALFHHSITSNLNKRNRERLSLGVLILMPANSIITTSLSNEHPQRNASKPNNERISDIATANSIKACRELMRFSLFFKYKVIRYLLIIALKQQHACIVHLYAFYVLNLTTK